MKAFLWQKMQQWGVAMACLYLLTSMLTGCKPQSDHQVQGYIEGRYTYMATNVSGVLKKLFVQKGDHVKQGDKLFALEEQPELETYQAAVENLKQAVASRDATAANLEFAKITYERYKILVPQQAIEQARLDSAKATYHAAIAQLAQAEANIASLKATLAQAKWTKEQKMLVSPQNAIVFDTYYRLGEYTQAGQPILSLLAPQNIKVIFYVPAPILGQIKLGNTLSVRCEACKQSYAGTISFISPTAEFTPPIIYSNETNAKLIFRIEGVFRPEDASNLHPGQPVTVSF